MIGTDQGVVVDGSPLADQLAFLVGSLHGPEQMHATQWAPAGTAHGRVRGELDVDGLVLVQHQVQERAGDAVFRAVNVFMADPAGRVLLYPFDSVGHPPEVPAVGSWDGGDLVFERSTPRGSARTTYTPTADGYTWSKQFRPPDGPWQPMIDGRLTREPGR
jgi:hypothetical protein